MSDPKRLLDGAPPRALERVLLESALGPGPTNDQCDALWAVLAHQLPPGGAGSAASGEGLGANGSTAASGAGTVAKAGAAAKTLGAGAMVKGLAVLAVAGATAATATMARPSSLFPALPMAKAPSVPGVAFAVPEKRPPNLTVQPEDGTKIVIFPPAPSAARLLAPRRLETPAVAGAPVEKLTALRGDSSLHQESTLLLHARGILRSGDCTGALKELSEARGRFPEEPLAQERESLAIQALGCAGHEAEAAERAAAFLRDYPASPLAGGVRRFARL
jgi:hypothetical protein